MKLKVGDKVLLKKSYAKWHLDHPEIYFRPDGTCDEDYEIDTLLHLMRCMGVPVFGKLVRESHTTFDCWLAVFRVGRLKMSYFVDQNCVEKA